MQNEMLAYAQRTNQTPPTNEKDAETAKTSKPPASKAETDLAAKLPVEVATPLVAEESPETDLEEELAKTVDTEVETEVVTETEVTITEEVTLTGTEEGKAEKGGTENELPINPVDNEPEVITPIPGKPVAVCVTVTPLATPETSGILDAAL